MDAFGLQWEIRKLLSFLTPLDAIGSSKIRVGSGNDGGYVMIDDFSTVTGAYSLGIGGDVSWDIEMARRSIPVFQYDHTVEGPPISHDLFHFAKIGIAATDGGEFASLPSLLRTNGHAGDKALILKMDIEGAEWEVLPALAKDDLRCFRQIVVELHGFLRIRDEAWRTRAQEALAKLGQHHVACHVHGNNWGEYGIVDGVPIPDVMEVTWCRRDIARFQRSGQNFPTHFDRPCHPDRPDFMLGSFSFL